MRIFNYAGFEVSVVFGIGMQELIIILVVALIFIGPKKLPDLAKALGKGVAQFKGAMDDVKGTFDEGIKKEVNQVKDSLLEDKSDKAQAGEGDKKRARRLTHTLARGKEGQAGNSGMRGGCSDGNHDSGTRQGSGVDLCWSLLFPGPDRPNRQNGPDRPE